MSRRTSHSTALENGRICTRGPALFNSIIVHNTGSDQFIHIYDQLLGKSQTIANLDVANLLAIIPIETNKTVSWGGDVNTIPITGGLVVVNSTTAETYTAGAADCWFTAVFE